MYKDGEDFIESRDLKTKKTNKLRIFKARIGVETYGE